MAIVIVRHDKYITLSRTRKAYLPNSTKQTADNPTVGKLQHTGTKEAAANAVSNILTEVSNENTIESKHHAFIA